ncbi:ABC transporter permease [Paenibacillus qinlingensis]|uniref:ABC transporter permease n=1 Tax=Paenibacillus qinlingensis TaxID=1837343 RepID=UPI001564D406|nr:ABC transporter permease [Paenibacillus qinlingensis]NQX60237.1 ABC transporter permease [Paenibacillus qinlingensis]
MKSYIENFMKYRYLLYELVVNDLKIKYRRSFLGILWSVLQPLMMMIILTIVFSSVFKSSIENFAVYVFTGRIVWDIYSQVTSSALTSIMNNAGLIKKVYVPKYIFPISKGVSGLVNTAFSLVALFMVMIFTGVKINYSILLFPLPILYLFLFSIGIGLIVAAYSVFFRDLNYLYELLLTAWMYFTPIFYPASIIPEEVKFIVDANPIAYFLQMFRDIVIYGQVPSLMSHVTCLSIGLVSLLLGVFLFFKKQDRFILHI